MSRFAPCVAILALSLPLSVEANDPAAALAVSKSDAESVLKATHAGRAKSIQRLAVTSCNVLFGTETSANAQTQAGFGEASQKRVEAMVSSTYILQGMDTAAMQALTEAICADAEAQLATSFTLVPRDELLASPAYAKLHAGGKPIPFELQREDAKYLVFAPSGQSVVDIAYQISSGTMGTLKAFGTIAKAISSGGSEADEALLLHGLGASGARINVMVDFARQKSNNVKGFLGKLAGNDSAKVDTQLQLSVSGFVRMTPNEMLKSYAGGTVLVDGSDYVRFTTKEPLRANSSAVIAVRDIQSGGSKAGEVGANLLAGAMALSGYSTSTTSIERNGVDVDPALYAGEVRQLSQKLVAMAAALAKP
jgi:hypothetical protein